MRWWVINFLFLLAIAKHYSWEKFGEYRDSSPGLSLIFEVDEIYKSQPRIRVAVVKSTCWLYIKVAGDIPQNTRGKSPAPHLNDSPASPIELAKTPRKKISSCQDYFKIWKLSVQNDYMCVAKIFTWSQRLMADLYFAGTKDLWEFYQAL